MIMNIIEILKILILLNKRKAVGLSINVIIVAVIGLIILVVVIAMLTGKLGLFGGEIEEAINRHGEIPNAPIIP